MNPLLMKHYDTIRKLFSDYGINSVTMDDIAVNIHASKKTIYKEYTCKDELVKEFFISEYQKFNQQLSLLKKENSDAIDTTIQLYNVILEKVFSINAAALYDLRKYYPILLYDLVLLYRKSVFDSFVFVLKKGETENLFHNENCIDSIANMFSFLFEAYVFNRISGTTETINPEWNNFLDYHFKSVCTPSGFQKWESKNQKNSGLSNNNISLI